MIPPTLLSPYSVADAPFAKRWMHCDGTAITVSVIIPALNEAENLPHVLPHIPSWVHEVLLVDGFSTDETVTVARAIHPSIRIVQQEGPGKGAALRSGYNAATGDILVMLDADGSTDPAEIPAFVGALLAGADFVKGSRFVQGAGTDDMPRLRKLGNRGFVTLANRLFGTKFTDITYGYNAIWSRHKYILALDIDNWASEIISNIRIARLGLRVVEVACFEHKRIAGEAKLKTFSAGWQILKAILAERFKSRYLPPSPAGIDEALVARELESDPALLPLSTTDETVALERTLGEA